MRETAIELDPDFILDQAQAIQTLVERQERRPFTAFDR
jgi:hypothetical protein